MCPPTCGIEVWSMTYAQWLDDPAAVTTEEVTKKKHAELGDAIFKTNPYVYAATWEAGTVKASFRR